jgi:hypothetical protein
LSCFVLFPFKISATRDSRRDGAAAAGEAAVLGFAEGCRLSCFGVVFGTSRGCWRLEPVASDGWRVQRWAGVGRGLGCVWVRRAGWAQGWRWLRWPHGTGGGEWFPGIWKR